MPIKRGIDSLESHENRDSEKKALHDLNIFQNDPESPGFFFDDDALENWPWRGPATDQDEVENLSEYESESNFHITVSEDFNLIAGKSTSYSPISNHGFNSDDDNTYQSEFDSDRVRREESLPRLSLDQGGALDKETLQRSRFARPLRESTETESINQHYSIYENETDLHSEEEGESRSDHESEAQAKAANTLLLLSIYDRVDEEVPVEHLTDQEIAPINDPPIQIADNEVCFGMIHNARFRILDAGDTIFGSIGSAITSDLYAVDLFAEDQCFFLRTESQQNVAVLNEMISGSIQKILKPLHCKLKAYITTENRIPLLKDISKVEGKRDLLVEIVVYGRLKARDVVGQALSSSRIYLQHPVYQEAGTDYDNPHFLQFASLTQAPQVSSLNVSTFQPEDTLLTSFDSDVVITGASTVASQIRRKVNTIFGTLTRSKNLKRLEADIKVRTQLFPHQEEGLDFMSQREFGPIATEYSLWVPKCNGGQNFYEHRIMGSKTSIQPVETGGGIIADDMGVGKTLTVISTIIRTADQAQAFERMGNQDSILSNLEQRRPQSIYSRSTLVVCPPMILTEWMDQINSHCDGSLNITVYHGRGRETNAMILADSDIVLSTYHTVASEALDSDSALYKITWFRIVLDEAHVIRHMSTKLFRAVFTLYARFRWCLTGTPVQNSLEDLASLVTFIRTSPLDNLSEFRKHIIFPFINNIGLGSEALRCLLDSICLRRTKRLLNLPHAESSTREIDFSPEERLIYNKTEQEWSSAVRIYDKTGRSMKSALLQFQLLLQLRRLCNHGTFQKQISRLPPQDLRFDPEEALALLHRKMEANCAFCNTEVIGLHCIDEDHNGNFTMCGHLICNICLPHYRKALRQDDSGAGNQCSLCLKKIDDTFLITGDMMLKQSVKSRPLTGEYFEPTGVSSKISALVADIELEPPERKGIVFSCWTRSLDLVSQHLESKNIQFARIDGSNKLSQRRKILAEFHDNHDIRILIMTTGTGATGLNVTCSENRILSEAMLSSGSEQPEAVHVK